VVVWPGESAAWDSATSEPYWDVASGSDATRSIDRRRIWLG